MKPQVTIFWFRRDLRLHDNHALHEALQSKSNVLPIFIFDTNILNKLDDKSDARVSFIYKQIEKLHVKLANFGSTLQVFYTTPSDAFKNLTEQYDIEAVFANDDYEGYAIERDKKISNYLQTYHIPFNLYKDHVIFQKNEVIKNDGSPYTIYTPYSKKWQETLKTTPFKVYENDTLFSQFFTCNPIPLPTLKQLGFNHTNIHIPELQLKKSLLMQYEQNRNFPALDATSHLGIYLRFGVISIRQLVHYAQQYSATFLKELIWREFYQMLLWNFPKINEEKSFKPEFEFIKWNNNEDFFRKWCEGKTGFPLVDAGIRQLNQTGLMHNRVRMVAASFLVKNLLIDWRWGEAYFAQKLLDFDFAANNGGWQWCAGTGSDAAPYFRIFNPELQAQKFDPKQTYIKKWVPEFGTSAYPQPIIDYTQSKKHCLLAYKESIDFFRNNV